jgi:hypothetical protein
MNPVTAEDWLSVAKERAADAEAMKESRSLSTGPVYMAGYAIECSLKAYLQVKGIPFPKRGSEGHDLKGLWQATCFPISDLGDTNGAKAFYIQSWSTDLRYNASMEAGGLPCQELMKGARALTGLIQNRTRRTLLRRKR